MKNKYFLSLGFIVFALVLTLGVFVVNAEQATAQSDKYQECIQQCRNLPSPDACLSNCDRLYGSGAGESGFFGPIVPHCGVGPQGNPPCTFCHFFQMTSNAIRFLLFGLAPIIVSGMVIGGGFLILTASGNPERVRKGKQWITWAVLGYLIMLLAWVIVNTIITLLGLANWVWRDPATGERAWWKIVC